MLTGALGLQSARLIALCGSGGKTTLMFSLAREFIAAGERVLVTTTTKIAREEADGWPSLAANTAAEIILGARERLAESGPEHAGAVVAYSRPGEDGHRLAGFATELVDELLHAGAFDRILVEADGSARKPLKAPAAHEPVFPATTDAIVIVAGLNGLGVPLSQETVFRAEIWSRLCGLPLGSPVTAQSLALCVAHPDGLARGGPAAARKMLFLNRADSADRRMSAMQVTEILAAGAGFGLDRVVCGWLLPTPVVADLVSFIAGG